MNGTRALVLAGAAVLVAAAAPTSSGASLPDWARAIADAAPSLPDAVPKTAARVLRTEETLTVQGDGSFRVRRRLAVQALRAQAQSQGVGVGGFAFTEGAKVRRARGWHLPPDGKASRSKSPELDVSLDDAFVSDARVRVVAVDDVRKGSLVFFEFESEYTPHLLSFRHAFIEDGPIDQARFAVEVPEGWEMRPGWIGGGPDATSATTTRMEWVLNGLPAPEEEPWGESRLEAAPVLVVGLTPPAGLPLAGKAPRDWRSFGEWFERIASGTDASDPALDREAEAATGGADTASAKVEALARLVRDRVRYVAQEIGIGGYRPRVAVETWASLYGDCKDKGTLFRAMLASRGVASFPLLVNAQDSGQVSEEVPDLGAFDHFVVGVSLPEGEAVPPALEPAVISLEGFGRILVVDTTGEYLEPGGIPAYLAGKRALLVAGERSRLIRLPTGSPRAHRIVHRLEVDLADEGGASYRLRKEYHGQSAIEPTSAYRAASVERERAVASEISRRFIGAVLGEYRAEIAAGGPFVESVAWTVPFLAGGGFGSFFPGVCDEFPRFSLSRRRGAVVLRHPVGLEFETSVRGTAVGATLPSAGKRVGPGWTVETEFDRAPGSMDGRFRLEVERLRFEPEGFPDLRELWSACARATSVTLAGP